MTWLPGMDAMALYAAIALALAAGLAASYGRELEWGRRPDRRWWIRRLLIMPILAIVASTASDVFELPISMAAFCAAMLALGGYDVLSIIEMRWKQRLLAPGEDERRTKA